MTVAHDGQAHDGQAHDGQAHDGQAHDGQAGRGGVEEAAGVDPEGADCDETIERLYWFLDGELTDERRQAIRSHLDDCGPCLEVMGFEAELRRVIADRCKDRVPDGLRERIAAAIHVERVTADPHD